MKTDDAALAEKPGKEYRPYTIRGFLKIWYKGKNLKKLSGLPYVYFVSNADFISVTLNVYGGEIAQEKISYKELLNNYIWSCGAEIKCGKEITE